MMEDLDMEWTLENDAKLTEMFKKRLSTRFIADWMRWPAAAVRTRLVELGLTKPMSSRAAAVVAKAAQPQATAHRADQAAEDDRDEDDEMRASPGCPRGHLMSESRIAALYSAAGGSY
jgi:hypothetical protein